MECVEAVWKTGIRKEMDMEWAPQAFLDDLWVVGVQNGVACDDFFVDELLDFSNEDGFVEDGKEEKPCAVSVSVDQENSNKDKKNGQCNDFSAEDGFGSLSGNELGVPEDDLESLEWLSNFVEDSNSQYSAPFPDGISPAKPNNKNRSALEKPVLTETCFKTPVPAKARSKRTRTGVRIWPLASPSVTESSSSSTSSLLSSSPSGSWFVYSNQPGSKLELTEPVFYEKPLLRKHKKTEGSSGGCGGAQPPRRCSHCGVQKTPQWRTGPLGTKTLCNACGVRYKSGRLLPEYRPACSPTFSSDLHSNHHRKVLEMRRNKENLVQVEPSLASTTVVTSFG